MKTTETRLEQAMRLHYRLMARKNFWYSKALIARDQRLCVLASDLRKSLVETKA